MWTGPLVAICAVRCGDSLYGLPAACVRQVLDRQTPAIVPLAPPPVTGAIVYEGDVLTVLRLSALLAVSGESEDQAMVVTKEPMTGESFILSVNCVEQVFSVPDADIEPAPLTLNAQMRRLVTGVCRTSGKLVILLDVASLAPDCLPDQRS